MNRSLLVIEHGFLKPREGKALHGVELFRMALIRDLIARGIRVSVCAERSWKPILEEQIAGAEMIYVRHLGGVLTSGLFAAILASGNHYDTALFGNARKGLAPAMHIVHLMGVADRIVLFAHRRPGAFMEFVNSIPFDVVANSEMVAAPYRLGAPGKVDVMYGLADAHRFTPGERQLKGPPSGDTINFCLLAKLPSVSKGMEKALNCFARLPADLKSRSRLHLAAFVSDKQIDEPGVVCHRWLKSSDVPPLLQNMDIMLCLSRNETFSQAIVQGMLTGLPIVATPLPVYVEKLDTGAGIVCGDEDAIVSAMVALAGDLDRRRELGKAGRATALDRYVWSTDEFIRRHLFPSRGPTPKVQVTPSGANLAESRHSLS